MLIPVLGMDPSLRHWGMFEGSLDLTSGELSPIRGWVIEPKDPEGGKSVRKNSKDLDLASQLAGPVLEACGRAKCVFVEIPVGSQSARAMASYGVCVGVLGVIRAQGIPLIEVSATENKRIYTGNGTASKQTMIDKTIELYPSLKLPLYQGKVAAKAEHIADAVASIHAGVNTQLFQNLMRLFEKV